MIGLFPFVFASRRALGLTESPTQWVSGTLTWGVKQPGREADRSPLPSTEVKNAWNYSSTSPYVFMAWCLIKYRSSITYTFLISEQIRVTGFVPCLYFVRRETHSGGHVLPSAYPHVSFSKVLDRFRLHFILGDFTQNVVGEFDCDTWIHQILLG